MAVSAASSRDWHRLHGIRLLIIFGMPVVKESSSTMSVWTRFVSDVLTA